MDWTEALEPDVYEGVRAHIGDEEEPDSIRKTVNEILRDWLTREGKIGYQEKPPGEDDPDA